MKNLFHKSAPLLLIGLFVGSTLFQPVEAQQRERGQRMTQEQREEMRDRRLENLPPEQREAMKKRMAERYGEYQQDKEHTMESWLTPEQREEVKRLRLDVAAERQSLTNQLNEAKARLKTVSTGDAINEREAKQLIDSISQLEADIKKMEWDLRMDVRAMLSEEQQIRFDQMPLARLNPSSKKMRTRHAVQHARMTKKMGEYKQKMHKMHHSY